MWRLSLVLALGCTTPSTDIDAPPPQAWDRAERSDVVVRGRDEQGQPLAEGLVTLVPSGRDGVLVDGEATLLGVPDGTYVVYLAAPGSITARADLVVAGADTDVELVSLPLDAPTGLRLQVRDPHDAAVPFARVYVDGVESGATDLSGRFEASLDVGRHSLRVEASDRGLGAWATSVLDIPQGLVIDVDATVPGAIDPDSYPVGSDVCSTCHAGAAATWRSSAHGQSSRTPATLRAAEHPVVDAIAQGVTVPLPSGRVVLSQTGADWFARVEVGSSTVPALRVLEGVGGHHASLALLVEGLDGTPWVLPVAWSQQGQGFEAAWLEGWTPSGPQADQVSYDLQCAGCHTTGGALTEQGGAWSMVPADGAAAVERVVGCEACHGDGALHRRDVSRRRRNIVNPARMHGTARAEVCAGCHSRVTSDDHPFSVTPGWPSKADGRRPQPGTLAQHTTPDRQTFAAVEASRIFADQVGDLGASPHQQGGLGYEGACTDCHVAHGSDQVASLRRDPYDNRLCTDCHSDLDALAAQAAHTHHGRFAPAPLSPGACVTCHLPRTASVGTRDPLTGVGTQHAHVMRAFHPDDILVDFDDAGVDRLGPGEVAVPGCMDCHTLAAERLRQLGVPFSGPQGDPYLRATYQNLGWIQDRLWGAP